jgi:hypothetical protein
MHSSTFTIILGTIVALVGASVYGLDFKSDDMKNIDPATVNLVNDNGLVTLIHYSDVITPIGTANMVTSSVGDLNNPGERRIYYNIDNNLIHQADIYRSDTCKLVKYIDFVEPDPNDNSNNTATIEADNTFLGDIEKLNSKMFDGRKELVEFDYTSLRGNLEKIKVSHLWNKDDSTEIEIDYDIFNKIEEAKATEEAVISQF